MTFFIREQEGFIKRATVKMCLERSPAGDAEGAKHHHEWHLHCKQELMGKSDGMGAAVSCLA